MLTGQRFLVHQWPDGCAVFDQSTGNTHALDHLSYLAFVAAERLGDDSEAISLVLKDMCPDKGQDELLGLAQACLERLKACGLIEPGNKN